MNIIMIPIDKIYPNPLNPRVDLGDLTELADSIRESGIRQNLTVVEGHTMTDEEYKNFSDLYRETSRQPDQHQCQRSRFGNSGQRKRHHSLLSDA